MLKSLQPFVAQPNSQGLSQQEEEMQLVQQLQQKCQEQLDRCVADCLMAVCVCRLEIAHVWWM